uniref:Cytochrome P450 n=1 Tax=Gongylonema pulchrum TaxID=637853 RepID=A0A183DJW6_9BILA
LEKEKMSPTMAITPAERDIPILVEEVTFLSKF